MNSYSFDPHSSNMTAPDPREPNERTPEKPPARDNEHPDPEMDRPAVDPDERINEEAEREAREEAGTSALPARP